MRGLRRNARTAIGSACLVALLVGLAGSRGWAADFQILYDDGSDEGFNDPSPATPAGDNQGPSVGEQRRIAVEHAVGSWADRIDGSVSIRVRARFDPLPCEASSAVLGQASPNSVHSDFAGAPASGVLYPAALANQLAGVDLCPPGSCRNSADLTMTFNSNFGAGCPFSGSWYYGLDALPGPGQADLVTVVLHELAHGLGFLSLVDVSTGERFMGFDDVFSNFVEDHRRGATFDQLGDGERAAAVVSGRNLHFVGPAAVAAGRQVRGLGDGGHLPLFAPTSVLAGSSLNHFDPRLAPDELMEPSLSSAIHDVGLAAELLEDLGWSRAAAGCAGDCDGDRRVSAADLVLAVRVALREAEVAACSEADVDDSGSVAVDELVTGVRNALEGCGGRVSVASASASGVTGEEPRCTGDCNADGMVSIGELLRGVNINLGRSDVSTCAAMDRNGDERVAIDELLAAVGSALAGCPCPFDLLDERAGVDEACVFSGRWNDECGDAGLLATFSVQSGLVGVAIVTGPDSPALTFFAQANTANGATLVGYMFGDEAVQLGGTIRLSEDRRQLVVEPAVDPMVAIDECAVERYDGRINRIVQTAEGDRAGAVSARLNGSLSSDGARFGAP
jgi:hypothetical protein